MRVLVVGSKGNMGRRYMAILKYLGVDALEFDLGLPMPDSREYDRAIIATPTEDHISRCVKMARLQKPFLCEKPIGMPKDIQGLIDMGAEGRMVCNWAFVDSPPGDPATYQPESNRIEYDNYNTGKDGLAWDCIQLIYLAKEFPKLATESPMLDARINGHRVHERAIAYSYISMIDAWLKDSDLLWSLEDAKKATEKVIQYMEAHP